MHADAVILDIDGVLTLSWRPIDGAAEAVARLRAVDLPLRFLTNTTSRSRAQIATLLRDAGIELEDDEVVTATTATADHLRAEHPGARCLVLNGGDGTRDLDGVDIVDEGPDVVVIGSPGPGAFTWEQLSTALDALLDGAPLVAMHRSLAWRTDDGWVVDGGAYLPGLEQAARVTATLVGKPAATIFRRTAAALGAVPSQTVMVGDAVDSDVLAAQAAGLQGILVRTGKFRSDALGNVDGEPDAIVDSVVDVPDLLGC